MKALDTNILVRFLTNDDAIQAKKVYQLFKNAEAKRERFFVPLLVVLELLWVLESVYNISKAEIVETISELIYLPLLKFENISILQIFIKEAADTNQDLSDILIGCAARASGCSVVLTFDKKAAKSVLFEAL